MTSTFSLLAAPALVAGSAGSAEAAVTSGGWVGTVNTSLHEGVEGGHLISFDTEFTLDGRLDQENDPFLFPQAAAFRQPAAWTMQVHEQGVDFCDLNGDGQPEPHPWSRQSSSPGSGIVVIQYGDGGPDHYHVNTFSDTTQLTTLMPETASACAVHPGGQVGVGTISAPIADHPAPVDSSGYTAISGEDTLSSSSIRWSLSRQNCQPKEFTSEAVGFDTNVRSFATVSGNAASWAFGDGTTGTGAKIVHAFTGPGEYVVTMEEADGCGAVHKVAANPVRLYRPDVWLTNDERFAPDNPNKFVRRSWLIYNKPDWDRSIFSHSCDDVRLAPTITPQTTTALNPLRLGVFANGNPYKFTHWVPNATKTRCRNTHQVISVNQYGDDRVTKDVASIIHLYNLTQTTPGGFVLDLIQGPNPPASNRWYAGDQTLNAPMAAELRGGRSVVYWEFYPYNGWVPAGLSNTDRNIKESHEGDWERIAVNVDAFDVAHQVGYFQHKCESMKVYPRTAGTFTLTHPQVFSARGGHASYPDAGVHLLPACGAFQGRGDATEAGRLWQPSVFLDATKQAWYGSGVAWGDLGDRGPLRGYGPAGPGPIRSAEGLPPGW